MPSFFRFTLILGTLAWIFGCSSDKQLDQVSGDVRVKMPWLLSDLALHPSDPKLETTAEKPEAKSNVFALKQIRLSGISNLKQVRGDYAEFYLYPQLANNALSGIRPEAQFFQLEKNNFVAKNALSMQMAVLYALAERMKNFDKMVGADVNQGPRRIAILDTDTRGEANNAFYHGESDAMYFLPFSGSELATMLNPGVYAHEHFHSLFYKLVHKPLIESKVLPSNMSPSLHNGKFLQGLNKGKIAAEETAEVSKLSLLPTAQQNYAKILIQGLNEGVADVWGWAYTGNPDFVALSLPSEKDNRSLNSEMKIQDASLRFPTQCVLKRFVEDVQTSAVTNKPDYIRGKTYEFGTSFSRLMKLYAETIQVSEHITSAEARVRVAKALVAFLPSLKGYYTANLSQMVPVDLIKQFAQSQSLSQTQCNFFLKILNAPQNDGSVKYLCGARAEGQIYDLKQTTEVKEEFCK